MPMYVPDKVYAEMTGALVATLSAIYIAMDERVRWSLMDCLASYGLFVLGMCVAAVALGTRVWKSLFTLLLLNVTTHLQHVLAHKFLPKHLPKLAFHEFIHHSKEGAGAWNSLREFLTNFIAVSWLYIPIVYDFIDIRVATFVGLLYASYHVINQRLVSSTQHRFHHRFAESNYGPDYMDALLHTKGDGSPEDLNSGILNIFLICGTMHFISMLCRRSIHP